MNIRPALKKTGIALGVITTLVILFYVHALAGLFSSPTTFEEPPAFVDQYAFKHYGTIPTNEEGDDAVKLTRDYFKEAALVRNVIVDGEPVDELIRLFTHPDRDKRVKIALAFADVNLKLSHDEGTNFDEKRDKFWEEVGQHSAAMQNATFEALIASAKERTRTFIPYTLAWWMQDDKAKTVEMLHWAGKHHPDPWVRNFAIFYVVEFGENEDMADDLIADRTHDSVFRVRRAVLDQRFRIIKESIFGKEE